MLPGCSKPVLYGIIICLTLGEEEMEKNVSHTLQSKIALCMHAGKSLVTSSRTDSHIVCENVVTSNVTR